MRLPIAPLSLALVGCAPGEEVSAQSFDAGGAHSIAFKVEAGDEIQFWNDFNTGLPACYRWTIAVREEGAQEATHLSCKAFTSGRCEGRYGNRYKNCQVDACNVTIQRGGDVTVDATLELADGCEAKTADAVLRVRRVPR